MINVRLITAIVLGAFQESRARLTRAAALDDCRLGGILAKLLLTSVRSNPIGRPLEATSASIDQQRVRAHLVSDKLAAINVGAALLAKQA